MNVAHICAGIGGSLLTGDILGWENTLAVELDPWRCSRVKERWPDCNVFCGDARTIPYATLCGIGPVDLVAAGFPCQDISCAGRGAGLDGPSTGPGYAGTLEAIKQLKPTYVFLENSTRIKGASRAVVHSDLMALGYSGRDGTLAALDVGAPHIRARWFYLGVRSDADENRRQRARASSWPWRSCPTPKSWNDLAWTFGDAVRHGPQEPLQPIRIPEASRQAIEALARHCSAGDWNPPVPIRSRLVDGLSDRGRWIAGLGDSWCPLQAAAAFLMLIDNP